MPRIKPYEQTLLNSCLTCSLLLLGKHYGIVKEIDQKVEERILKRGLEFDKNYEIGQLHEVAKRYKMEIDYFIEDIEKFHHIRRLPFSKRIIIHHRRIDPGFLREKLKEGPVIISIDPHGLFDEDHYSHFVLIAGRKRSRLLVLDPWTGEQRKVECSKILQGIRLLKKMGIGPVMMAKRSAM